MSKKWREEPTPYWLYWHYGVNYWDVPYIFTANPNKVFVHPTYKLGEYWVVCRTAATGVKEVVGPYKTLEEAKAIAMLLL